MAAFFSKDVSVSGDKVTNISLYRACNFMIKKMKAAMSVGFHVKVTASIWKKQLTK